MPTAAKHTPATMGLLHRFDANDWADRFAEAVQLDPSLPADPEAMLEWFAGAIMAGYEHAYLEVRYMSAAAVQDLV